MDQEIDGETDIQKYIMAQGNTMMHHGIYMCQ